MALIKRESIAGDDKILVERPSLLERLGDEAEQRQIQLDTKTKQIQAQGCIQAAVQSPGLQMLMITDYDGYWKNVKRLADDMLAYVAERSK